jgi:hypothetical protein
MRQIIKFAFGATVALITAAGLHHSLGHHFHEKEYRHYDRYGFGSYGFSYQFATAKGTSR